MANGVSFRGLGSGIDFKLIRDAILASLSRSITLLQGKVTDYSGRIEAPKTLNTGLAGLISASEALTNQDLGFGRSTTTSNASIATATASSNTAIGTYGLNITRLASNLTQTSRSYASEDDTVLKKPNKPATFELRTGGSAEGVEFTIDSSNDSLVSLRDAINAADAGVNASIIDVAGDGTGYQLVLASDETGSAGRVELVETSSTKTIDEISLSSVNPASGDFAELDAVFSINGLQITRGTNTIDDAISGVTINLKEVGETSISVVAGIDIQDRLQTFVNQYNAIQDFVGEQYNEDSLGWPTGALAGDSSLRNVQQQLRSVLRTVSKSNGGSLTSLSDIRVNVIEGGKLELDIAVLDERLLEIDTSIFQGVLSVVDGLGDSITGSVQAAIDGYQSSIETINDSIANRLEYIDRLRDTLTRQFAAADAATVSSTARASR